MEVDAAMESVPQHNPDLELQSLAPISLASTSRVSDHLITPCEFSRHLLASNDSYGVGVVRLCIWRFQPSHSTTTRKLSWDRSQSSHTEARARLLGIPWSGNGFARNNRAVFSRRCVTSSTTSNTHRLSSITYIVVRAVSSQKIIAIFSEVHMCSSIMATDLINSFVKISDLQAEKRGNFVVIGCVEGSRVISWSLNVRLSTPHVSFIAHE